MCSNAAPSTEDAQSYRNNILDLEEHYANKDAHRESLPNNRHDLIATKKICRGQMLILNGNKTSIS